MTGAYFDIEIFSNYVSVLALDMTTNQSDIDAYVEADINDDIEGKKYALSHINYKQFVFHEDRWDAREFFKFFDEIKLLVGFNSIKFDDLIIDYIYIIKDEVLTGNRKVVLTKIKNLVDNIISNNNVNYKYFDEELKRFQQWWTSIDLYMALFETVSRKSLKQAGINIKWYRIEDLPFHPDKYIFKDDFQNIFDYNINDVLITRALHVKKKKEIALRISIGAKYGVNVLSSNRSTTADRLMSKFYSDYTGLKYFQFKDLRTPRVMISFGDILNSKIRFETPVFKALHEEMINTDFFVHNEYKKVVLFKEKGYTIATGGLHSIDRPARYEVDNISRFMEDADVSSYYPRLIANEGACPAHLANVAFSSIVNMIMRDRLAYKSSIKPLKKEGRLAEMEDAKTGAEALKIVANSGLFGKMGYDGWLHDLKAMYQVTLNGQLYLLMLIEQLEEAGIEIISANTDGVLARYSKDKADDYRKITFDWQKYTNLELEFARYIKYVRTSVNDYIAIKEDWLKDPDGEDNIKRKGDFLTEVELSKGFNAPVVAIALDNYIVKNIPIEDTIYNHTDIYDYCISVKTGEAFQKQIHKVNNGEYETEDLSKNLRYFVSNKGGTLLKRKVDDKKSNDAITNYSYSNMIKGYLITPFNDYFRCDMKDYDINYNYYIKRVTDILLKIEGVYRRPGTSRVFRGSKKKGVSQVGNMFDNI